MRNYRIKTGMVALFIGTVSVSPCAGMDMFDSIYNSLFPEHKMEKVVTSVTPIYDVGATLHQRIQSNPMPTNSVHCALGVNQTLALLSTIADKGIQNEIKQFTGDQDITGNLTALNTLLKTDSGYTPKSTYDERKFELNNGVYALLADWLKVSSDASEDFSKLGAQCFEVDFSNPETAAATLNGIVAKDTHGKITEILSADAFTHESLFVLLHTLYLNASWKLSATKDEMSFSSWQGKEEAVDSLKMKRPNLQFSQKDGVTLVAIPTVGDGSMVIRHSAKIDDLKPITESELTGLRKQERKEVQSLEAPFVSMNATHNLKEMLADFLPKTLQKSFVTELCMAKIEIADYIQKVTFEMTDKGVEASAATAMHGMVESCAMRPKDKGPIIKINSPFTFVFTKSLNGVDYPMFQGQVVNHEVLNVIDTGDYKGW